jgi:spore maturation protein CgeB
MKLVVFGLTISSSWGNGHATLWRGLSRALGKLGHRFVFFERDAPYYAAHRDLEQAPGGELVLYRTWEEALPLAREHLADADAAIVTSYCPDAIEATALVLDSQADVRAFYDLDTPVTLDRLRAGEPVEWVGPRGFADFDLVLSYSGGSALDELRTRLAARRAEPLYGHVDPEVHRPCPVDTRFAADLSYLGTYSADRAGTFEQLFLEPARRAPGHVFMLGGPMYPASFPWLANVKYIHHVEPREHPAFYGSSPLTLNVTRRPMAEMGWCPSGRLFEAAACGIPVLSDAWDGLETFFRPGEEVLVARTAEEALGAIELPRAELAKIGAAARERTLGEHTSEHRARELVAALDGAARPFESVHEGGAP